MNLNIFNAELAKVKAHYQIRIDSLKGAQIQVEGIEHESGHGQQTLINIEEGLQTGTMSEDRAIELMKKLGKRFEKYSEILSE